MSRDVLITPSLGQIKFSDDTLVSTETIAITSSGGALGGSTVDLVLITDDTAGCLLPGANGYGLGTTALRWAINATTGNYSGKLTTSQFQMTTGASSGYVLTADSSGNATWQAASGGVTSFNTRTGTVTLSSSDVTGALTYTPVNKTGDTMTGTLTLKQSSTSSFPLIITQPDDTQALTLQFDGSNFSLHTLTGSGVALSGSRWSFVDGVTVSNTLKVDQSSLLMGADTYATNVVNYPTVPVNFTSWAWNGTNGTTVSSQASIFSQMLSATANDNYLCLSAGTPSVPQVRIRGVNAVTEITGTLWLSHPGVTSDNETQEILRIKPRSGQQPYYRGISLYNSNVSTDPLLYTDNNCRLVARSGISSQNPLNTYYYTSEYFGSGATGTGYQQVALGTSANCYDGGNNIAIGFSAACKSGSGGSFALGASCTVESGIGVAMGSDVHSYNGAKAIGFNFNADNSIVIGGYGASSPISFSGGGVSIGYNIVGNGGVYNILIGDMSPGLFTGGAPNQYNQLVFGYINHLFLGGEIFGTVRGVDTSQVSIQPAGQSVSDTIGANMEIRSGKGTGTAKAGNIIFKTGSVTGSSGTTLNNNQEKARLTNDGYFGINNNNPGAELDVKGTVRISGSTSGYVGFVAQAAAGSAVYTLPNAYPGADGYALVSTMGGALSWAVMSGSSTSPGGSSGQVQYNSSGSFAGSTKLLFDNSTGSLAINNGASVISHLDIAGAAGTFFTTWQAPAATWAVSLGSETVPYFRIGGASVGAWFWQANWNDTTDAANTFKSASNATTQHLFRIQGQPFHAADYFQVYNDTTKVVYIDSNAVMHAASFVGDMDFGDL